MKSLNPKIIASSLIFLTLITSYIFNWKFIQGETAGSLGVIGDSSGPKAVFVTADSILSVELGLILIGLLILGFSTKKVISAYKGSKMFRFLGIMYVLPIIYLILKIA